MLNYGDPKYWKDRYKDQKEETFEWFAFFKLRLPLGLKITNLSNQ